VPDVTAASSVTTAAAGTSGTVTGAPRRRPRLEAAVLLAGSLIAFAHIGADRLLGYGLKYGDNFQHTHLGQLGQPGGTP
jgi:hypothetical protein